MIYTPFWSLCVREVFVTQILALEDTLNQKILLAFQGIKEEAERVKDEKWHELRQSAGPDDDPGAHAELARDEGIDYYLTMCDLRQGITNLFAVATYHLFEQQLFSLYRHEPSLALHDDDPNSLSVDKVVGRLRAVGIDVAEFQDWDELKILRLVCNTVKHADGRSATELRTLKPSMFQRPGLPGTGSRTNEFRFRRPVYQPLFGEDFFVTPEDLNRYFRAVRGFWAWLASASDDLGRSSHSTSLQP